MPKVTFGNIIFIFLCLGWLHFTAKADTLCAGKHHVYIDLHGHGYLIYSSSGKISPSLNYAYRFMIDSNRASGLASIGWGALLGFRTRQVPGHPAEQSIGMINFIPIEFVFLFGNRKNQFNIGGAITFAWGEHGIDYIGSQGSTVTRTMYNGRQYVAILGYSYFDESGYFGRIALTPHFYDSELKSYEGKFIHKATWIPLGLSVGYSFN